MYKRYNPNPKRNKAGDCTVRALTKALNISWEQAYGLLCEEGLRQYRMPHATEVYEAIIESQGYLRRPLQKVESGMTRLKVSEFVKKYPKGTYVLGLTQHVVTVIDGVYYDSWDCGTRSVYRYYERIL